MVVQPRRLVVIGAGLISLLLVAIPVMGADPSAPASSSPSPSASTPSSEPSSEVAPGSSSPSAEPSADAAPSTEVQAPTLSKPPDAVPDPDESAKEPKGKKDKSEKAEGVPVTVIGTVAAGTDGKGRPTYTLTADGKTWELSAGPPWFWGDKNPLNAYVGKSVTVVGSAKGTEIDVETVDGTAIRAPGKPPWAGGPWVVGPTHPGWKPWKVDGKPGKGQGHGRENAPGQNKDKTKAP